MRTYDIKASKRGKEHYVHLFVDSQRDLLIHAGTVKKQADRVEACVAATLERVRYLERIGQTNSEDL